MSDVIEINNTTFENFIVICGVNNMYTVWTEVKQDRTKHSFISLLSYLDRKSQ